MAIANIKQSRFGRESLPILIAPKRTNGQLLRGFSNNIPPIVNRHLAIATRLDADEEITSHSETLDLSTFDTEFTDAEKLQYRLASGALHLAISMKRDIAVFSQDAVSLTKILREYMGQIRTRRNIVVVGPSNIDAKQNWGMQLESLRPGSTTPGLRGKELVHDQTSRLVTYEFEPESMLVLALAGVEQSVMGGQRLHEFVYEQHFIPGYSETEAKVVPFKRPGSNA